MSPPCNQYDVIVLGAGASGLMCAITAAARGRRVLVLEKSNKVGKKILMSGGGRCNFTNYSIAPENFISANPHFCKSALSRYSQWDFIAMVERYGIEYEERKHGQLFCKDSASQILTMLLDQCEQAGVEIRTHSSVNKVEKLQRHEAAQFEEGESAYKLSVIQGEESVNLSCQSLVVATGALSIPTLGGSGLGYALASQFEIPLVDRQAGLVPFMFSDQLKPVCEALSGLALEVEVSCNKQSFRENLLFTHRGMSGPVMLQISNYWNPGDEIEINLLPHMDAGRALLQAKQQSARQQLKTWLSQHLAKSLVHELQQMWWPQFGDIPLAEFSDSQLLAIAGKLHRWQLKPSATEGYRTAEVTLGGVDTHSISSKTMEARQHPGLFFIGEVMDVTGHLGGYNFQWAWSSGYTAGLFV